MSHPRFNEAPQWQTAALPPQLSKQDCLVCHTPGAAGCTHINEDRVALYIDYENLHIGLKRAGYTPDPATLIAAARKEFAGLGRIVKIFACGDWEKLSKNGEVKVSDGLLKELGVTPRSVKSRRGKNSADLVISGEMQTQVDCPSTAPAAADVFVIGTCDSDFSYALQHALDSGKRVRLLSLRRGVSQDLVRLVGRDNVRYLEPYFVQWSNYPQWGSASDQQFRLVLRTIDYLHRKGWQWVYADRLVSDLALGAAGEQEVLQAVEDQLFKLERQTERNVISLDLNHPDTYGADWLYNFLDVRLNRWKMKYVGTPLIKRGMHEELEPLGADCSWEGVKWFLRRAAGSGVVTKKVRKVQPRPEYPGDRTDTWWLAGAEPQPATMLKT